MSKTEESKLLREMERYFMIAFGILTGLVVSAIIVIVLCTVKNADKLFDEFIGRLFGMDKPIVEEVVEENTDTTELAVTDVVVDTSVDLTNVSFWVNDHRIGLSEIYNMVSSSDDNVVMSTMEIPDDEWAYKRLDVIICTSKDTRQPELIRLNDELGIVKLPIDYSY